MMDKVLKSVLLFLTFVFDAQAFWWQSTTTESPAVNVKHIPLTYFRTYTYQPLTGGPFSFPFGFGGSSQTPILNGGRYEQLNFPNNPILPPQRPTTTKPTTTTTTTTTPAPTTTTTSTTTTTTTTKPKSMEPLINTGGGTYGPTSHYEQSIYPTYNRRMYMNSYNDGNYYRPSYPYPDYATATKTSSMLHNNIPQRQSNIQFVPCMCPINVGVPTGIPIIGSGTAGYGINDQIQNIYMPQARSNDNNDDSVMELPLDEEDSNDKSRDLSKIDESLLLNDDMLLSDDRSQTTIIETNKIDNGHRKPNMGSIE